MMTDALRGKGHVRGDLCKVRHEDDGDWKRVVVFYFLGKRKRTWKSLFQTNSQVTGRTRSRTSFGCEKFLIFGFQEISLWFWPNFSSFSDDNLFSSLFWDSTIEIRSNSMICWRSRREDTRHSSRKLSLDKLRLGFTVSMAAMPASHVFFHLLLQVHYISMLGCTTWMKLTFCRLMAKPTSTDWVRWAKTNSMCEPYLRPLTLAPPSFS